MVWSIYIIGVNLIRFETRLDFTEETVPSSPAGCVYLALTGKKHPPEGKPDEPGVRVRNDKDKLSVLWRYNYCSVLLEDEKEKNRCIDRTIGILERIDNSAKMGKLKSFSLTTHWILPVKGMDFKELELKYRDSFIKESEIFYKCVDSSVILDIKQGSSILHHQSGAMQLEQLVKDYRVFNFTGYEEKLFIFLLVSMSKTGVIEYTKEEMKKFLSSALKNIHAHAEIFGRIMEGKL
ncbi:hypothetical protein ACFLX3_05795 [Chloroflexota bacterium]